MRQNLALPARAVAPRSDPKTPAPPRWLGSSYQALQRKLRVGAVDDPLEREADRVADAVGAGAALSPARATAAGAAPAVQPKCAACETEETIRRKTAEEEDPELQLKAGPGGPAADGAAHAAGALAGGTPLSADVRAYFEPRFGRDLSDVRVHADSAAARGAQAINARAYTLGRDIAFAPGEYAPGTREGRRLIAHELAHVAQQSGDSAATIRRWSVSRCNTAQSEYVNDAITRAHADLTTVAELMRPRPVPAAVRNALWLAFRDDSASTQALVARGIEHLRRQIIEADVSCQDTTDPSCQPPAYGFARGSRIYMCVPAFTDLSYYEQSGAMIHEAAHRYLGLADTGYFVMSNCAETAHPRRARFAQDEKSGTEGDNPVHRLENADAYRCFVHFLRYTRRADLRTGAAAYRGEDLRIEPESATIYTQTSAPGDPTFRVRGVPDNSGFRFRWRLLAGGREFGLETREGGDTGALREGITAVNVSREVRRLLESLGITEGTIVCEIELFRPFGERFPPPLIEKRVPIRVQRGFDPLDIINI